MDVEYDCGRLVILRDFYSVLRPQTPCSRSFACGPSISCRKREDSNIANQRYTRSVPRREASPFHWALGNLTLLWLQKRGDSACASSVPRSLFGWPRSPPVGSNRRVCGRVARFITIRIEPEELLMKSESNNGTDTHHTHEAPATPQRVPVSKTSLPDREAPLRSSSCLEGASHAGLEQQATVWRRKCRWAPHKRHPLVTTFEYTTTVSVPLLRHSLGTASVSGRAGPRLK